MSNWVPDEEGLGCVICHAEFSLVRRRHHCRKCGALVCGSCSDHFLPLNNEPAARVCDNCEIQLKEAQYVSERLDVNGQIGESLKSSLREKNSEMELYTHFSEKFGDFQKICTQFRHFSKLYDELKMDSAELEREIRSTAQRCLKAESILKETAEIPKEIEKLSLEIGRQQKLMTQLQERMTRHRTLQMSPRSSPVPASPEMSEIRPAAPSLCQIARALLF